MAAVFVVGSVAIQGVVVEHWPSAIQTQHDRSLEIDRALLATAREIGTALRAAHDTHDAAHLAAADSARVAFEAQRGIARALDRADSAPVVPFRVAEWEGPRGSRRRS